MAALSDLFDVLISKHGSGWKGANLQVKNWIRPPEFSGKTGIVCLTNEALTPDEFDQYVDQVIAQLQAIKKTARRKIERMNKAQEQNQ